MTKPFVVQTEMGPMKNFVYFIGADDASKGCTVVDPAWNVEAILKTLKEANRTLSSIFLTHHHPDHINGVEGLLADHDVPVYVQKAEADFANTLRPFSAALKTVEPGEKLSTAGVDIQCILTPGHTPGSQCLLVDGALFSGDTLFVNACGRCDFKGSDPNQMFESLHKVIKALPDSTILYPGHDYGDVKVSSLQREYRNNPYYQQTTHEAFERFRMRR